MIIDPPEPPQDVIVCQCAECGEDIYEGDDVYIIDHDIIHKECIEDYFSDNLREAIYGIALF